MRSTLISIFIILNGLMAQAQFVAKMEVTETTEGICDENEVYALFPMFDGQDEAVCPVSEAELLELLNAQVEFLKSHPKHKDKGMMGIIINCEGEVVQCEMDNKTKDPELDRQIEAVFRSLGEWKAGELNGQAVDSSRLFSFTIKKGQIIF